MEKETKSILRTAFIIGLLCYLIIGLTQPQVDLIVRLIAGIGVGLLVTILAENLTTGLGLAVGSMLGLGITQGLKIGLADSLGIVVGTFLALSILFLDKKIKNLKLETNKAKACSK